MSTNITKLTDPWHYYTYRYDQLNRLKGTSVYKAGSTATPVSDYQEGFTYDGNGNILTATRNAGTATAMDNLAYKYNRNASGRLTNNELNYITNAVTTHNWPYGLNNQTANNYTYDAIGNMTADIADTISNINWTVYNKIQSLTNSKGTITYTYDPSGQRVSKTLNGITTWYIRDAQGNTLALYDNKHGTTNWKEQDLYGSSRLGMWQPGVTLSTNNATAVWDTTGNKEYELSNHLGNVLATINDKRIQHSSNGTAIDYFDADIATAQEYYAFGGVMPGRTYVQASNYRYGFNGKENDNDVKGTGNQQDYGMRIYDNRVGRFLSVDPLIQKYPYYTPYSFAGNKPTVFIDRDGEEEGWLSAIDRQENTLIGGTTKFTPQQIRDGQRERAVGGLIGTAIVSDVFLTKGKVSQFLLTSQFLGAFHDNRARTPAARKQQDKDSWQQVGESFVMWGTGEILGKTFDLGASLFNLPKSVSPIIYSTEVFEVNGIPIKNLSLANQTLMTGSGHTVTFDEYGFPDFTPYSIKNVKVEGLTGDYLKDEKMALKAAGMKETPQNYVWHHHQDGETMQLVPKYINNPAQGGMPHTGGTAIIKHNNNNPGKELNFPPPNQ